MNLELRRQIGLYLNGQGTLEGLEIWLVSNLQTILDSGDEQAIEIANQLDSDIVDLGEELLDKQTFLGRLLYYLGKLETIELDVPEHEIVSTVKANTSAESIHIPTITLFPVETLRWKLEFA